MRQRDKQAPQSAEETVRDIRRATRRHFSAEEKIRIVLDRIVTNGSPSIPLKPSPLEPAVDKLRRQYPEADDDERLLRFMFAGPQVDEMRAAGAMKTEYLFQAPLARLVQELASRRIAKVHFSVARGA